LYREIRELGLKASELLDFSVSTNPYGPPKGLARALQAADLESYPDSDSNDLKNRLAESLGLLPQNLIAGSGSTELIRLSAAAYLGAGSRALVLQPTYGEYAAAVQLSGAAAAPLVTQPQHDFRLDPEELLTTLQSVHPRVFFWCNPNNPTGDYADRQMVERAIQQNPDTLIVLDEAYAAFVEKAWSSSGLAEYPNLLVIRSMTKDYAMAGIRLGYAFGHPSLIATLNKVKPPWNVSAPAQCAGLFVLNQSGYIESMRSRLSAAGGYLKSGLLKLGLRPLPSRTNYFMLKVGRAEAIRRALLLKGILVRDCTSFGLPEYIRLAVRTRSQCRRLLAALGEIGVKNYVC